MAHLESNIHSLIASQNVVTKMRNIEQQLARTEVGGDKIHRREEARFHARFYADELESLGASDLTFAELRSSENTELRNIYDKVSRVAETAKAMGIGL